MFLNSFVSIIIVKNECFIILFYQPPKFGKSHTFILSRFQMLQSGQGHQIIQTASGQQIVVQSGQSIQVNIVSLQSGCTVEHRHPDASG